MDDFINKEVYAYYEKIIKLLKEDTNIEKQECNHIIKSIRKISNNFSSKKERIEMIEETIELSKKSNVNFKNSLDNNKVIHFTNGLYKIDENKLIKHKASHLITMTIGYEYCKKYSDNINNLLKYLEDILPNKEVREYFLTHLGKCLCSDNNENITTILIGECDNLIELIKFTFGDYYSNNTENIKKRICIKNNFEKLGNNIPLFINIKTYDKFIHDDKYRYISFLNDINENNISLWKQDFMLLLLENYNQKNINIPNIILVPPKELSSNIELIILIFLSFCTKKGNNIFSTTLYESFKNWYCKIYPDSEIIGRNKFILEIKKHCKYNKHIIINKEKNSGFENLQLK